MQPLERDAPQGDGHLAPFQEAAVNRAVEIARRTGGVILADAVGMGKTRMALAIARILARDSYKRNEKVGPVYGIVPSRLRTGWHRAAAEQGWEPRRELHLISHAELSRHDHVDPEVPPSVLIVDEAHGFRNPEARRSLHLSKLTAYAPTVLVTATPICNGIDDLYHLFRLFLADHDLRDVLGVDLKEAFARARRGEYDLTELIEHLVIRRVEAPTEEGFGRRPPVSMEVVTYDPPQDEAWLWAELSGTLNGLNLRLISQEWPRQLFVEYVLKRWESGPDALEETLQRLVDYHERWLEARGEGRDLCRAEFARLFGREGLRDQGVFPFVYDARGKDGPGGQQVFPNVVLEDLAIFRDLLTRTSKVVDQRAGAPAAMGELIAQTKGEKFLIFSTYQRAARGIYETLCDRLGTQRTLGLVTGAGAWATGLGKTRHEEILRRFAPIASGERALPPHQSIDVLVCTDCLSEGVNLQDCARVILADLPYSPLKIEQRIGRLVRPGALHERVQVYWLRPRHWQDTLGLRRRLDRKLDDATSAGVALSAAKTIGKSPSGHDPNEPLAALTGQDRLASELGALPWEPPCEAPPRYFWAAIDRGREALYLRVIFDDGLRARPLWCVIDREGNVHHRLAEVLPELIALADRDGPITACAPDGKLLEAAKRFLEERRCILEATRHAPLPLPRESPQQGLWRILCDGWNERNGDALTTSLDALRPKLLRPYPRGIEHQLEELLRAEPSVERVVKRLAALPALGAGPRCVTYRILWGLQTRLSDER